MVLQATTVAHFNKVMYLCFSSDSLPLQEQMLLEHQERTHRYEALNAKSCTLESELDTAFLRILELKQHR